LISSSYMKFQHAPAALLWSKRHLAFHCPLAAGGKINFFLYKYSSKFWFYNYLKSRSVYVFTLYITKCSVRLPRLRTVVRPYVLAAVLAIGSWRTCMRVWASNVNSLHTYRSETVSMTRPKHILCSLHFFPPPCVLQS
jgi:hypothetical protein